MRRTATLIVVALATLVFAAPAGAITYGTPDGDGHPWVAALVRVRPSDGAYRILCSGTLISPDVVLTAGHCTDFVASGGATALYVSFDPVVPADHPEQATLIPTTGYLTHPDYNPRTLANDVGLVFLDGQVSATPAQIIDENGLSDLKASGGLKGATFTAVGYGLTSEWQYGPPVQVFDGVRRVATSPERGLTKSNLILLMNHSATGQGGTCSGDSGGPHFLGDSNVIASVTSWGDPLCRSLDQTQRIDIPSVHGFIEQYLND